MNVGRHIGETTSGRDASALLDAALRIAHAVWIAAVLVIGLLTLITVLAKRSAYGAPLHEHGREAAAVALASEIESRWRQTLDVEVLLDDYFARDIVDRMGDQGPIGDVSSLDPWEQRRALVSSLNVAYLQYGYMLDHASFETGEVEELLPPGLLDELEVDEPAEARRALDALERAERILRGHVTTATFESQRFRRNARSIEGPTRRAAAVVADSDSGYAKFGIAEGTLVYEVPTGPLWLTFAETDDGLRIVAIGFLEQ
jgi:hypothetical protein